MGIASLPRGLRNNNPLNLRKSDSAWLGMTDNQTDHDFIQFRTIFYGLRAAFITVRTHLDRDARLRIRCTVEREISRWAPPSENNTEAYIAFVCRQANLKPTDVLEFTNRNMMCRLLWAMALFENGIAYEELLHFSLFERAYVLAAAQLQH